MQSITITFTTKRELTLPMAHSHALQGLVYHLLSYDPVYSTGVHNKTDGDSDAIKLFCFSDVKGGFFIRRGYMHYNTPARLEIRSADDAVADIIRERLSNNPCFSIGDNDAVASDVCISSRTALCTSAVYTLTTPAVVYRSTDGRTIYYSPADDDFTEIVCSNLRRKYRAVFGEDYSGSLSLSFPHQTIKKCVTRYKGIYITAYYGSFSLIADPRMHDVMYYCGIGSKNSMGFGVVD